MRTGHKPAAYQPPKRLPLVSLAEVTEGWFPGLERACPHCGGWLWVDPPADGARGRVTCQMCGRQTAEVTDQRVSFRDLPPERRGRAPIHDPALPCSDCGTGKRVPNSARCNRCRIRHYRTRADPFETIRRRAGVGVAGEGY